MNVKFKSTNFHLGPQVKYVSQSARNSHLPNSITWSYAASNFT